jgi:hypothetical protein
LHNSFGFQVGYGARDCGRAQTRIFGQKPNSRPTAVILADPVNQDGKDHLCRSRQVSPTGNIFGQLVKQHVVCRMSYVVLRHSSFVRPMPAAAALPALFSPATPVLSKVEGCGQGARQLWSASIIGRICAFDAKKVVFSGSVFELSSCHKSNEKFFIFSIFLWRYQHF